MSDNHTLQRPQQPEKDSLISLLTPPLNRKLSIKDLKDMMKKRIFELADKNLIDTNDEFFSKNSLGLQNTEKDDNSLSFTK